MPEVILTRYHFADAANVRKKLFLLWERWLWFYASKQKHRSERRARNGGRFFDWKVNRLRVGRRCHRRAASLLHAWKMFLQ